MQGCVRAGETNPHDSGCTYFHHAEIRRQPPRRVRIAISGGLGRIDST